MNRGNQQEIGLVARLDWLAGIMDGEGCIALLAFRSGKQLSKQYGIRLQMRITIGNSNLGITDRIASILQELDIKYRLQDQKSKSKGRETGRTMRLVHVQSKANILRLLKVLQPRIADTEKLERARIMIKLIEQRDSFAASQGIRAHHCYTQADVDPIIEFLRLTRSTRTERLAEILNDCTRETRKTVTKKSRARHDTVWTPVKAREGAEMPSRQAAMIGQ